MTRSSCGIVSLALSLAAALWAAPALAASPAAPADAAAPSSGALTGPQVGQPAPDFTLKTTDGRTVRLSDYRGKTLVLNVWATWCPPCREETPDLLRAYSSLAGPNVAFLGIDDTEQAPIVRAFVAAKGVPYPQAIDSEKTFSNAYDIRYFPTTFVVDRDGIIRARNIDVVTPAMLHDFVAAANAGRNAVVTSPQQEKIDALLSENVVLTGDPATIVKGAKRVNTLIDQAEDLMSNGDPAKGMGTDFLHTRAAEAALRDRAIVALAPVASTPDERALLAVMRGDAARDREQWSEALAAYDAALAIDPKDEDALSGLAFVASPLKEYGREAAAYAQLVVQNPDDVDALIDLAEAQSAGQKYTDAIATAKKATALAMTHHEKKPNEVPLTRKVAATHLVTGRIYAKAGDAEAARAEFAQLIAWTMKLPKTDARYAMYLEEAQEAQVALDLNKTRGATQVSLTPWTGADLPGSTPNTLKYRLVVAGSAGRNVNLHAADVPKGWVASFCTDRLCAPYKVSVVLPPSGVKVIEFQLVPPDVKSAAPRVRVISVDGAQSSSATT